MMMMIDDALGALAASAVHPGLDGIEAGVRARIDADARHRRQARHGMLAAVGAASLAGLASAGMSVATPPAPTVGLLPMALAPSTLLAGE